MRSTQEVQRIANTWHSRVSLKYTRDGKFDTKELENMYFGVMYNQKKLAEAIEEVYEAVRRIEAQRP